MKLHNFCIRGNLLQWFRDFLSGRFQRVIALGVSSEPLPVLSGVPQGSILGPLLFIIYVNDLPKSVSQDTTMAIFADDTKCYRPIKNSEDNKTLQSDLDNITIWCHEWKMDLNQTKCGALHLTRSREPTITQYTVLDSPVNRSNSQRDLGLSITSDLKWNKQVQDISLKANKMLGFVKRTTHVICNQSVRKALYLTMVRSHWPTVVKCGHLRRSATFKPLNAFSVVPPSSSYLYHTELISRTRIGHKSSTSFLYVTGTNT